MKLPERVKIIDVGPRDGLQNEKSPVPADIKIGLVHRLQDAGLKEIEVTSYVSPKWVPQMADNHEVMAGIRRLGGVRYSVLTPNLKGFESAVADRPDEIVVFGAASEAFSQKNINCSIAASIERFAPVVEAALAAGIAVRGAMSCTVGCPYEGEIAPERVAYLAGLLKGIGVQRVESSVAGLGGCPYAKGATGNVATEDVVYMLHGMGIETGIDLDKLIDAGAYISDFLGRKPHSLAATAILNKRVAA